MSFRRGSLGRVGSRNEPVPNFPRFFTQPLRSGCFWYHSFFTNWTAGIDHRQVLPLPGRWWFNFLVSCVFHDMTPVLSPERQQQSIHNLQIIFLKIHYFCAKVRSPLKVIQLKFLSILFDHWRHKICLSNLYRSSVRNEVFHLVTSLKTHCSIFTKPTFFSFFHWFLNEYREQAFNLLISNISTDTHWYSKNKSSDSSFSTTLGARG